MLKKWCTDVKKEEVSVRMKILIICNCATGLEIFRGMLIRKLVKRRKCCNCDCTTNK